MRMISSAQYRYTPSRLRGSDDMAGSTDRRAFLRASCATLVSLVLARGANAQEQTDKRTLREKIKDFLTLRLTFTVIDDYILNPLASALENTNQSADAVLPLYNIVELNAINYGRLSTKLEWFAKVKTPTLRALAARDVADVARDVNVGLQRLRDAVLSIGAGAVAKFDPQVAQVIKDYASFPGVPSDIERFLLQGSSQEITRIADDCKSAQAKVREASDAFLCRLACRYDLPHQPNCRKC